MRKHLRKYLKNMTRDVAKKVSAVFHTIAGKLFKGKLFISIGKISFHHVKNFA